MKIIFGAIIAVILAGSGWAGFNKKSDMNAAAADPNDRDFCEKKYPMERDICVDSRGYHNRVRDSRPQGMDAIADIINARPEAFSKKYLDEDQIKPYFKRSEDLTIEYFTQLHQG